MKLGCSKRGFLTTPFRPSARIRLAKQSISNHPDKEESFVLNFRGAGLQGFAAHPILRDALGIYAVLGDALIAFEGEEGLSFSGRFTREG